MERMLDLVKFKYCPRCGEQHLAAKDAKSFICSSCGFVYYHSTASVVSAIIECAGEIILTRRAFEPGKGALALPGGFVDYQENLESALIREMQEELDLRIADPTYLCSLEEKYLSGDVLYFCNIAFFVVRVDTISSLSAHDDIEDFLLVRPEEIDQHELAFETDGIAIDKYRSIHSRPVQSLITSPVAHEIR
jgi:ADP-ribose pyrophosphatase YjhB (NUDIX family)